MSEATALVITCLAIVAVVFYMFYYIISDSRARANKENLYEQAEETALDNTLKKLNINVEKYLLNRDIKNTKSFQQKLQQQMIKDHFKDNK